MKRFYGLAAAITAALMLAAFVADVAKAEMVDIYGPVYIAKTKHHGHERKSKLTFSAPVAGAGVIIIKNGGDSGVKYRVKSAEIELNENDVARPRDFNANVAVLRYNVELLASNELEVDIESCKECELSITVQGEAAVTPVIRPLATDATTTAPTVAATVVATPVPVVVAAPLPATRPLP
ncbi:hypothetical protein EPN18_02690 [bacterium]|nr:MAG: hypothetical protein EPN18_02690 [bacterium]